MVFVVSVPALLMKIILPSAVVMRQKFNSPGTSMPPQPAAPEKKKSDYQTSKETPEKGA